MSWSHLASHVLGLCTRQYADWAEEEFGRADLGDARLDQRLRDLAQTFFNRPQANVPQACGSRAATKAAYRFFARCSFRRQSGRHSA